MNHGPRLLLLAMLSLGAPATAHAGDAASVAAQDEFEAWRERRVASLTSDTGWLTLVGLHWLEAGDNSVGRAAGNRVVLDHPAVGDRAGSFMLTGDTVTFTSAAGGGITYGGEPAVGVAMVADTQGTPTVLEAGSLRFHVIEREGRFGIRVRDLEAPARLRFRGLEYFPFDPGWIIDARFEPYQPAKDVVILNVLAMEVPMVSPGALVFRHGDQEFWIDALLEDPAAEQLFLMFTDGTSGRQTYGAGRFLYVPRPAGDTVRVDFNRAYNPPCAFSLYATCPLPPPQNRLSVPIEAGELDYDAWDH